MFNFKKHVRRAQEISLDQVKSRKNNTIYIRNIFNTSTIQVCKDVSHVDLAKSLRMILSDRRFLWERCAMLPFMRRSPYYYYLHINIPLQIMTLLYFWNPDRTENFAQGNNLKVSEHLCVIYQLTCLFSEIYVHKILRRNETE